MTTGVTRITLPDGRHIGVHSSPGRGPAVVLLHGLLDSAAGWATVSERLGRRSYALDLPGFGESDQPLRPRISAYADDVLQAMDVLRVRRAVIIGHSLGGAVAAALADRAPERVESLVLLAPAGFGRIALAEAISIPGIRNVARIMMPLALGNTASVRLAYSAVVSNHLEADDELLERITTRAGKLVPGAVAGTQAVVAAGLSKRALYRRRLRYRGPAMALWGTQDKLVPPGHAAGVARGLPQAEILRWPGMGHHPQRERLDALVDLLDDVITGVAQPRRRAA